MNQVKTQNNQKGNQDQNQILDQKDEDINFMSIQQSIQSSQDLTKETSLLSIQQNNKTNLDLDEIIALYNQIDRQLFDHQFPIACVIAEKNQFQNISEIENQTILLHNNQNSTIIKAFLQDKNNKLIIMKQINIDNQEMLIKKMDEYKIHHKINKFYPQQSLELILPVRIKKDKFYEMISYIERAEVNLYDYSQSHQISQEEADRIFQQLLQQIIDLHQINIAHRDIKPQNVLYDKEKGWLISDYGESIEYRVLDNTYDIRGTLYFLMPAIQRQIKIGSCKQNLLQNDIYALIVSIIMIQQQNYIKDIEQQITLLNNQLFNSLLQVKQLDELISFQLQGLLKNKLDFQLINVNKLQIQKESNKIQKDLNQQLIYKSWLDLYAYTVSTQTHTFLIPQILKLIQKNYKKILSNHSLADFLLRIQIKLFADISIIANPNKWMKDIINSSCLEHWIKILFQYGYSEKTIFYAEEYLNNNYSQEVHLTLIDSYERAQMFKCAEYQFQKFLNGLLFDYLGTENQIKFFQYLGYYQAKNLDFNINFCFNYEEQLIKMADFQNLNDISNQLDIQYLAYENNNQNKEQMISFLMSYFTRDKQFFIQNFNYLLEIVDYINDQFSIDILLLFLQRLNLTHCIYFDSNRKIVLCFQICESFLLLNKNEEYKQYLKKFKQTLFQTESWQQSITFKIYYIIIQIKQCLLQNQLCQTKFQILINKFFIELNKFKFITFQCYKKLTIRYFFLLLHLLSSFQITYNNKLIFMTSKCIYFAFLNKFHLENLELYNVFHNQALYILLMLKNKQRCLILVNDYMPSILEGKSQNNVIKQNQNKIIYINKPSIRKLLSIQETNKHMIQQILESEILFNRYLF